MDATAQVTTYLIYVWIRGIHPMLWRRFLVRAESTLADLHYVIQIGFGWTDFHLHRFRIRKKSYTVPRIGMMEGHDARTVKLADVTFRMNERFLNEYDFGDLWQHEIRIEQQCVMERGRTYPVCVGGKWAGPPEDCGGPDAFLERRSDAPFRVHEILDEMAAAITARDLEAVEYRIDELQPWREWLRLDRFDRRAVNRRLAQYAVGNEGWMSDD